MEQSPTIPPERLARAKVRTLNKAAAAGRVDQRQALIDLLARSIQLGHTRLAVRRWLMLRTCGHAVPPPIDDACRGIVQRIKPAEVARIERAVAQWHAMVCSARELRAAAPACLESAWNPRFAPWLATQPYTLRRPR